MRLWSIHPSFLDPKGLVALWREALLAQKVLQGRTKGYRFHPQLQRFRSCPDPMAAIATYLWGVHEEAVRRGYRFDAAKIEGERQPLQVPVTQGQINFEWQHLKAKLRCRAAERYRVASRVRQITPHPLFVIVPGGIELWER
jgi:hypothetical protein